ncbi:MAG: hypothetical protein ACRBN8_15125 [Nannocystales bacterium]
MTTLRTSQSRRLARIRPLALGFSLLSGAFVLATPSQAHAADSCKTAADVSSKVWKETPGVVKTAIAKSGPFGATAIQALKLIDEGVKIWNKLSGDKSWKTIGPRRIDFEKWNKGTLLGPTERMFISGIPAVNPVEIDFHKLDHGGKVKVVVCKVPNKGKAVAVKSFEVAPDARKGKIKTVRIDDAKGHIITVVLHGKSVTNKLKYKVRARMIHPEDDDAQTVTAPREDNTHTAPREDGTVTAPR